MKMQQHVCCFYSGTPTGLSIQEFCWGLVTWVPNAYHVLNPRLPEGKQVEHKSFVCISSLSIVNYPYQLRNGGNVSKVQVRNTSQDESLQAESSKDNSFHLLC